MRFALKTLGLAVAFLLLFAASFAAVGPRSDAGEPDGALLGALPLVALLCSAVLAWIASHLKGGFVAASAAMFVGLFGPMSFMSQIESAFFVRGMPLPDVARVAAAGLLCSLVAAPLAVWTFRTERAARPPAGIALPRTAGDWLARIGVIAVLYLALYFGFGYFVAWSVPEVRAFYGGGEPQGFFSHLLGIARGQPDLLAFQVLRAALWTAIATPLVARFGGSPRRCALAVGLAFAVFMNAQLLLPNAFMPEPVRMVHLVETGSSNLLFGAGLVGVLAWRPHRPAEPAPA